jgi:predicted choloylglycine hydrolase
VFRDKIAPEHLAEIQSLAAAAKIDESDALLMNCFLDLMPMTACSSMTLPADASPDHVARVARNLDFPTFGVADKASIVLVYHPTDGRYGFVSVSWPGLIGALSAMNEHGLALANMEVTRPAGIPTAMPYALLYRTVVERCKTVDEAIDLLKKTPRQTPNNLMLMDASGDRAVLELTPGTVVVRRADAHTALISTNHQRGEDLDTPGKCDRFDYLHDTAKADFGKLDIDHLQAMLQHVQQPEMTIQSMVFEPTNRVIYLSTGMNAAQGKFTKIELKRYFSPSNATLPHADAP